MSSVEALFERFDVDDAAYCARGGARAEEIKSEAYAEGYAAGEAAAMGEARKERVRLETAADMLMSRLDNFETDASALICRSLAAAISKVLPALSRAGFALEANALLEEYAALKSVAVMSVKAASEPLVELRAAIEKTPYKDRFQFETDDSLGAAEVSLSWGKGGVALDLDGATDKLVRALNAFAEQMNNGVNK